MIDRLRLAPWRARILLLALPVVLAAAIVAAALLYAPRPAAAPAPAPAGRQAQAPDQQAGAQPSAGGLLVEVSGAVAHPGLYRLQKGQRVDAAIAAAGGLAPQADQARLPDMAKRLTDGMQVDVPAVGATSRSGGSGSGSTGPSGGGSSRSSKVDLNTATVDQLAALPGFTPDLASAAVAYREQYGSFNSVKELVTVLNMSQADYAVARKYLRV
jgi:competence protein ComEA